MATSVTKSPFASNALHPDVEPVAQVMPPPLTVPVPVPLTTAVSAYVAGSNFAVTVRALETKTVQEKGSVSLGTHPAHDLNDEPAFAEAVSVTVV